MLSFPLFSNVFIAVFVVGVVSAILLDMHEPKVFVGFECQEAPAAEFWHMEGYEPGQFPFVGLECSPDPWRQAGPIQVFKYPLMDSIRHTPGVKFLQCPLSRLWLTRLTTLLAPIR